MEGGQPFDIKPAGMLALDVARDRGRTAADRRRLLQQQEGADRRRRGTRRTRWGSAGWSASTRAGSSASRRFAQEQQRGPRRQIVGLEIDWTEVERLYDARRPRARGRRDRVARGGAGLPERQAGREGDDDDLVAGAEADDRAGDGRPAALRRRHAAADRADGRSRAPPRRRDGRADAVLQPAAEDGDAAGVTRV